MGLDEMDWTKKVGRKQVGRKLGARVFSVYCCIVEKNYDHGHQPKCKLYQVSFALLFDYSRPVSLRQCHTDEIFFKS